MKAKNIKTVRFKELSRNSCCQFSDVFCQNDFPSNAEDKDLLPDLHLVKGKGNSILLHNWTSSEGFRNIRLPEFLESPHMKLARL